MQGTLEIGERDGENPYEERPASQPDATRGQALRGEVDLRNHPIQSRLQNIGTSYSRMRSSSSTQIQGRYPWKGSDQNQLSKSKSALSLKWAAPRASQGKLKRSSLAQNFVTAKPRDRLFAAFKIDATKAVE